jgi:integrase/recombinase XerD
LLSWPDGRVLTAPEFFALADMPAETEWFDNIDNPNTRRAYKKDIIEFNAMKLSRMLDYI